MKKLGSLTALGAGVLTLGAAKANASVIYIPLNAHIGFGTGGVRTYVTPGIGPTQTSHGSPVPQVYLGFFRSSHGPAYGTNGIGTHVKFSVHAVHLLMEGGTSLYSLRKIGRGPARDGEVPAGFSWASVVNSAYSVNPDFRVWKTYLNRPRPPVITAGDTYNHEYYLFKFNVSSDTYYGWLQLSASVTAGIGNAGSGPDVYPEGLAWDTTPGERLAAGELPEPPTAASTGLAALALGAIGLRKWRKLRKAA